MSKTWWWKAIGILLLTVIALLYILPTVAGDRLPSWFTKAVSARLNLGLDLQGGIHLVYEVQTDKAVADKADRLAADIEERLIEDKKVKVTVDREGRDDIRITFKNPKDIKVLDDDFMSDYSSNLTEVERDEATGVVLLRMDEDYVRQVSTYAVRQAIQTIRNRVDQFGVAEPSILQKGRDIVVELPGLTSDSFERVKKQIGRTAQLEFKMVDDTSDFMQRVADKVPKGGPIEVRTGSYSHEKTGTTAYTYLQSKDKKALLAFIESLPKLGLPIPKDHEILLGEEAAQDAKGRELPDRVWVTYYVKKRTELTGEYITDAQVQWDERTGKPQAGLTFDRTGARLFEKLSGDNVGRRMAIVLDNIVNSAPVFQTRIGGGRAVITLGGFKPPLELQKEAQDLTAVLRSGALPAPLTKTFERQVGPTLGRDAIERGTLAFAIGGALVVLFILYYYRGAGLVCDIALLLNFLYIMAIMAGFQATLTLPGIAGLVLTIGMAVDANVIIYERIREELRAGKTARAAVDAGYGRAFWTIFDAQITTAIAGVVLLQYGSGPIRGFALTLLIGILCSMFTGVVVTRLLLDFVVEKLRPARLSI